MMRCPIGLMLVFLAGLSRAGEMPRPTDPACEVIAFAGSDLIVHPTGITVTRGGKILVVESHTHFRPEDYSGPQSDQIVWLEDTDGDGRADRRRVFYGEDLATTMDIATHPQSGAIYVATRNEVLRLWDRDDDGRADAGAVERRLVFLDTAGNYPHNGCSGLCFDAKGDLYFGIGENLGEPYTLIGSDGVQHSDQGEGGNIWHCDAEGGSLRRFATGFWNPFGVCTAPGGHIFATDNDPSSRPPCRLHYVIEGGDYGYQYRYGRSGQHPFVSWDGELPGTLPMLHGTGEAPCDLIHHRGNLIVTSWSDHRLEVYPLRWAGTHFVTEQGVLVRGGVDFRPVALAIGADGDLYVTDWVKRDYQLHGEGAVWRLSGWEPSPVEVGETDLRKGSADDPWTFSRMISGEEEPSGVPETLRPALELLRARFHGDPGEERIRQSLRVDAPEELRLLAFKWIADEKLSLFEDEVEREIEDPASTRLFHAAVTARERIRGQPVMDRDLQKRFNSLLREGSPAARRAAFYLVERRDAIALRAREELYDTGDIGLRKAVALSLVGDRPEDAAQAFAREILQQDPSALVRSLAALALPGETVPIPRDPAERAEYLFHRHCASCHRVDGLGKGGGPDLSQIGLRGREHIETSIRDPSREVAPQFEAWRVTMSDGSEKVGYLIGEEGGTHLYGDAGGNEFRIDSREMVSRESLPVSLMPPGLDLLPGEADFSSLVDWLTSLR